MTKIKTVESLLQGQQVVPVVAIENEQQALGLAAALIDGGIKVIEITLRSKFGIDAIEIVSKTFPEMLVVAGTVNSAQDAVDVVNAGAQGVVSPGITSSLMNRVNELGVAYLPGVATPSEIMLAMAGGLTECKLFPAKVVGGIGALKAFSGPFASMRFCPTGGVGVDNYQDFLAQPNVMCVGGTWIAPTKMIQAQDWAGITALCKSALAPL